LAACGGRRIDGAASDAADFMSFKAFMPFMIGF